MSLTGHRRLVQSGNVLFNRWFGNGGTMLGWFKKKPPLALASTEEREAILAKQHPLFREVDAAFHAYPEVVTVNSQWDDGQVEQELLRRGVAAALAEECVTFGPMAWGREVVEQLGVTCSPLFRLHSLVDGTERDMPLANEFAYAWARAMIGLYRTVDRNAVFKLVATRSAEVNAVSNALNGGVSATELKSSSLQPSLVHFRRTVGKVD
jgi:hypothetical protein